MRVWGFNYESKSPWGGDAMGGVGAEHGDFAHRERRGPLFDRLFSNNAGLWSVYKVIPASMFVSMRFLNFSSDRILARDSR